MKEIVAVTISIKCQQQVWARTFINELSVYLSVCLSVFPSVYLLSICLSIKVLRAWGLGFVGLGFRA